MKERRTAAQRATGIAGSVAAAVRRRQQAREPRVLLYDEAGEPRVVRPDGAGYDDVLAAAELLVEHLADGREDLVAEEAEDAEVPEDPSR